MVPEAKSGRWTKQDIEDAKKIKYVFGSGSVNVWRVDIPYLNYSNVMVCLDGYSNIRLNPKLVPSLKQGELFTVDEILGGKGK